MEASEWKIDGLQIIGSDAARILAEAHIKAVWIECFTVIGVFSIMAIAFFFAIRKV